QPYSVVLFDEIEKAHPEVFNVLLQVLDDGRLTDGKGRTVDFRNTVIIMTSNISSQTIYDSTRENRPFEEIKREVVQNLRVYFKPEFLNRIDEIVIFKPLDEGHLKEIVNIQLNKLMERLKDKNLTITLSDRARETILREGFDPALGARPLRRALQRLVMDPLALKILSGEFKEGENIYVDVDKNGELAFIKKRLRAVS
ncbi:MAG: AAA family ATPase, partial [Thermoplasmata archaeon]